MRITKVRVMLGTGTGYFTAGDCFTGNGKSISTYIKIGNVSSGSLSITNKVGRSGSNGYYYPTTSSCRAYDFELDNPITISSGQTVEIKIKTPSSINTSTGNCLIFRRNKSDYTGNYVYVTENTYTVSFNGNGNTSGSCPDSVSKSAGSNYTLPGRNTLVKRGYTFEGWSKSSSGSVVDSITVNSNITLYAIWSVNTVKLAYHPNGGTVSKAELNDHGYIKYNNETYFHTINYGSDDDPYNASTFGLTRTGYNFKGWKVKSTGDILDQETKYASTKYAQHDDSSKTTANTKTVSCYLHAEWTANKYTVTLNNQDATTEGTTSVTATYDSNMPSITVPTRTGYTFGGYYTSTNGGGTQYYTDTGESARKWDLASNTTLYAKWVAKGYIVTFNANGGSCSTANKSVTFDSTYGTLPTPTRTGHTFVGWFTEKTGGTQVITSTPVSIASNHTLYAHWQTWIYTIQFDGNSPDAALEVISVPNSVSKPYGISITLPNKLPELSTEGAYIFSGWNTMKSGKGTTYQPGGRCNVAGTSNGCTVTLYAQWVLSPYIWKRVSGRWTKILIARKYNASKQEWEPVADVNIKSGSSTWTPSKGE